MQKRVLKKKKVSSLAKDVEMGSNRLATTPHGLVSDIPSTPMAFEKMLRKSQRLDEALTKVSKKYRSHGLDSQLTSQTSSTASSSTTPSTTFTPSPIFNRSKGLREFNSWKVGERYKLIKRLGGGSYGEVVEAFDVQKKRRVAIKRIPRVFEQEVDAKRLFREIFILRHLKHVDVIKLLDIIDPENYESFEDLYLVFEFVDTDLYKLILSPQYLTTAHIKAFLYQILCGVQYIHSAHVIHRDIKPANVLLNEDCTLKLCDFGLSRVIDAHVNTDTAPLAHPMKHVANSPSSPFTPKGMSRQLTQHVVTRWYRAPELILLQDYDGAVDVWSIGCILAELLSMQKESCASFKDRKPLFPGKSCFPLSADQPSSFSDNLDQLNVIFDVIGTPSEQDTENLGEVGLYLKKLQHIKPRDFREIFPGASPEAIDLLQKMLLFNPTQRITVSEALKHVFFKDVRDANKEVKETNPISMEFENVTLDKNVLKAKIYQEIAAFKKALE